MDTSKVIRGVVNSGRYTVTAPIVKEDYGLYLQIEGVELPQTYEVDFSNSEHNGTSVTMIGNSDGVLIPHQFIDTGKDIFAFLYHVGADFGRTVYKFRIPNKCRPDRTEEEPTPEEQSVIDQCISALNEAVAQTAGDVESADQSARDSAESARASGESALSASNSALSSGEYASNALGYAESASASATASANSASQSAQIKDDVEGMVDDAQGYASASAQSATASANSASQALSSAQSATASASSAQGYASQAQTSANTASNKASEASTSAQTASNKASEASQSASQALTYKTDAESAKTASQTAQGLAESARDSAVQAKTDAESARDTAQALVDGISGKVEQIDQNTADIASLEADRYKPYAVDSASGAIASFSDGADDIPLKSLIVNIDPVQDTSSGDPSPENICPISGWTEVNVNHSDADMTNPTTLTIQLGQTVYGAKLYPLEGKAVVDRAIADFGTLTWSYQASPAEGMLPRFATASIADSVSRDKDVLNGLVAETACSIFALNRSVVGSRDIDYTYCALRSTGLLYVIDTDYSDVASFTSGMNGVQFVYPLAEPIEIQLTPHEVNSLLGVNNIWADTGDTACEYRADTKLYINKKIAEALASLT